MNLYNFWLPLCQFVYIFNLINIKLNNVFSINLIINYQAPNNDLLP